MSETPHDIADRWVADIRVSMKLLQQQHANAWEEVDRLHNRLQRLEKAVRVWLASPQDDSRKVGGIQRVLDDPEYAAQIIREPS